MAGDRAKWLTVAVVGCIVVAIIGLYALFGRQRLPWGTASSSLFDRLQVGMSYEEVQQVLGGPGITMPRGNLPPEQRVVVWPGPQPGTQITVIFERGRLKEKYKVGF